MKKKYLKPEMDVHEFEQMYPVLLAGSGGDSKEQDFDMDDEYYYDGKLG